jgi:Endonuclease-reverse transcriptase
MVLLGDFNLPDLDWHFCHGPDNIVCNTITHFINSYGPIQYVDQPTRENNIIDLIPSSSSSFVEDLCTLPPIGTSDHNVIMFTPYLFFLDNIEDSSAQQFHDWKNADYEAINVSTRD